MKVPRNKAAKGKQTKARRNKVESVPQPPPAQPPKVWQPGDDLEEGEELDFDVSAYDCLVRLRDTWPCLSLDIVRTQEPSADFPHSVYFVSGTQAPNERDNYLSVLKLKSVQNFKQREAAPSTSSSKMDSSSSESESDSSESEEDDSEEKEQLLSRRIRHKGGVNRVRCMPQDPRYVAVWSEKGVVQIFDLADPLNDVHSDKSKVESTKLDPVFSHKHKAEGFAVDWSSLEQGLLASGDCESELKVWYPSGTDWKVSLFSSGHTSSVEDIQWSPTEATVLASCSVDKTVKIWDSRERSVPLNSPLYSSKSVEYRNGARLSVSVSDTDVNVISWNKEVAYMLASGDDSGKLKIWDLRNFQSGLPVIEFGFHKKSITSVEWCPHESSMVASSAEDDQIAIWDLALERDPEEEASFPTANHNADLPPDVPPQLLFLHSGQSRIKEVHWHPQIKGMIVSTAEDGFNVFKPANVS